MQNQRSRDYKPIKQQNPAEMETWKKGGEAWPAGGSRGGGGSVSETQLPYCCTFPFQSE